MRFEQKLGDKLKIWFIPAGWRPKDVSENFPIKIIEDPYKYTMQTKKIV